MESDPPPVEEKSAFWKLLDHVDGILNAHEKRSSLSVEEGEWQGIDSWLDRWRGRPWPSRPEKAK